MLCDQAAMKSAGTLVSSACGRVAVFSRLMTSLKRNSGSWWRRDVLAAAMLWSRVRHWLHVLTGRDVASWPSRRGPQPLRHAQPNSRRNLAVHAQIVTLYQRSSTAHQLKWTAVRKQPFANWSSRSPVNSPIGIGRLHVFRTRVQFSLFAVNKALLQLVVDLWWTCCGFVKVRLHYAYSRLYNRLYINIYTLQPVVHQEMFWIFIW